MKIQKRGLRAKNRAAMLLIVLFGVSILSFALSAISPIDPAEAYARRTNFLSVTPERIAEIRVQMGLDKPIHIQYMSWLRGVLKGDFGISLTSRKPVTADIAAYLPLTLKLSGLSLLLVAALSIPIAAVCAMRKNGVFDHITRGITIVGLSMPNFWLGFLLLLVFAVMLPVFKVVETGGGLRALFLPALALAIPIASSSIRIFRATILAEMNKDYVAFARARGLSERRVLWMHVLKNALPSMVTMLCQLFGYMLAGCAVLEKIFSLGGLGSYLVDAIIGRDLPAINGCVFVIALIFVAANTFADILNPLIAPRMAGGSVRV
ncbi:MAG: ABC transporter permease [Oscillospiraceae bacterium]|jgi:ABC-type dipeptide/oligopeptide/nickel transport system permease component|nr:ABC transporter permease [Oscillospiraceae bacterium]